MSIADTSVTTRRSLVWTVNDVGVGVGVIGEGGDVGGDAVCCFRFSASSSSTFACS